LCLILMLTSSLSGQTLVGIKGGVNWSTLWGNEHPQEGYMVYSCDPSFGFKMEIKGRKKKYVHLGVSASYSQSVFNWKAEYGGYLPDGKNITYRTSNLYFTVFPEFSIGRKFQFYCNVSPYISFMLTSSREGYTTTYTYYPVVQVSHPVSGTATNDLKSFDFGFQESIGISYMFNSWFGLTLEENGFLGLLNINKVANGSYVRNKGMCLMFGVSFLCPKKKPPKEDQNSTPGP
jgi:hypothetical protein